jgi:hypothetical protein
MLGVVLFVIGFCAPIITPGYGWAWMLVTVGIAAADVYFSRQVVKI